LFKGDIYIFHKQRHNSKLTASETYRFGFISLTTLNQQFATRINNTVASIPIGNILLDEIDNRKSNETASASLRPFISDCHIPKSWFL